MIEGKNGNPDFSGNNGSCLNSIGILGGTFNPIHMGHLIMAEAVCMKHHLSRVIFVPAYIPPHKYVDDLADARQRYQMVEGAINGNGNLEVSDLEIRREGRSYTIDTVREIMDHYGRDCEIFLIMGADSLNELELWKDIKGLSQLCRFVVVNRPGFVAEASPRLAELIGGDSISDMERLKTEIEPVGISSTVIRERLRKGLEVKGLVPVFVEEYIRQHGLYSCQFK